MDSHLGTTIYNKCYLPLMTIIIIVSLVHLFKTNTLKNECMGYILMHTTVTKHKFKGMFKEHYIGHCILPIYV